MKYILLLLLTLFISQSLKSQKLEVEGKMLVKDINTIATFQSTVKNSFIRLATNDDPSRGTNVGYFDNEGQVDPEGRRKRR